ncbi:hypothetical protein [Bradyrhizobium sp.]|nr:hypothetical protein [Bradyrhizobium sp.]
MAIGIVKPLTPPKQLSAQPSILHSRLGAATDEAGMLQSVRGTGIIQALH